MIKKTWKGGYKRHKWDKFRTRAAISHPAKMANGLLDKILRYLMKEGLLRIGDTVLDPMAGIGTTALGWCALHPDNRAITVELEEKFIEMQKDCKKEAEGILKREMKWTILKGDARHLSRILKEKGPVMVMSPPYGNPRPKDKPEERDIRRGYKPMKGSFRSVYPAGDGQIGNLPDKPVVVISPPYGDTAIGYYPAGVRRLAEKGRWDEALAAARQHEADSVKKGHKRAISSDELLLRRLRSDTEKGTYSDGKDNIGNLPDKPVTVMSPPYEDAREYKAENYEKMVKEESRRQKAGEMGGHPKNPEAQLRHIKKMKAGRPEDPNNIGKVLGGTYLGAMAQVYQEIAKCSSICITVTKNPTRKGKLRRLDLDTKALLEASGFTITHWIKAILFDIVTQKKLDGTEETKPKGRLSFFKRLSFAKGLPVARWEDVLIGVRI